MLNVICGVSDNFTQRDAVTIQVNGGRDRSGAGANISQRPEVICRTA
jgi:hypothetical protein